MDKDEVVDEIRQTLAVDCEDATAQLVLGRPARRPKPGGIPVDRAVCSDSDSPPSSPELPRLPPDGASAGGTREECRQRVLARAKHTEDVRLTEKPQLSAEEVDRLFVKRDLDDSGGAGAQGGAPQPGKSLLSKLVEESGEAPPAVPFSEFAMFESNVAAGSKCIKIVFAFAPAENGIPKVLDVRAKSEARIKDFIGLCLYQFVQRGWTPTPRNDPRAYKLYLADDIFDYDTDLPALDAHRPLSDIGFSLLALVESGNGGSAGAAGGTSAADQPADRQHAEPEPNNQAQHSSPLQHLVKVWFVDGTCIDFHLDDLDETVGWLRDQAVTRREAQRAQAGLQRQSAFDTSLTQYRLESADLPGQRLRTDASVGSVGASVFLCLRENSSRGGFVPPKSSSPTGTRTARTAASTAPQRQVSVVSGAGSGAANSAAVSSFADLYQDQPAPMFVEAKTRPADLIKTQTSALPSSSASGTKFGSRHSADLQTTPSTGAGTPPTSLGTGTVLDTFFVERIHGLKPKWTAKLTFRDDCVTLVPIEEDRRKMFVQTSPPKSLTISWDLIGGVDYSEQSGLKRTLRIVWLPMSAETYAKQQQLKLFVDFLRANDLYPAKKQKTKGFSLPGSASALSLFSLHRRTPSAGTGPTHSVSQHTALHRVASTQSGVLKPTKEEEDGPEASGSAPDSNSASTSARSTVDQQLTIRSEGPTTAQAHNGFEENSPLAEQQPPATPRLPDALTGFNPKELQQAYEQLQWKFVSIETTDDEAWKIGLKLNDILDQRRSPVRALFQASLGGEKRPSWAAESVFQLKAVVAANARLQLVQAVPGARSNAPHQHRRRFSVNPMPILSKMWAKHD